VNVYKEYDLRTLKMIQFEGEKKIFYCFGICDYLQKYTLEKKVEYFLKKIKQILKCTFFKKHK